MLCLWLTGLCPYTTVLRSAKAQPCTHCRRTALLRQRFVRPRRRTIMISQRGCSAGPWRHLATLCHCPEGLHSTDAVIHANVPVKTSHSALPLLRDTLPTLPQHHAVPPNDLNPPCQYLSVHRRGIPDHASANYALPSPNAQRRLAIALQRLAVATRRTGRTAPTTSATVLRPSTNTTSLSPSTNRTTP